MLLLQNAEFVDMTLAAEGRLVQVHKNIVALASPYLKAMLQSAPCQHPVIFLNVSCYFITMNNYFDLFSYHPCYE